MVVAAIKTFEFPIDRKRQPAKLIRDLQRNTLHDLAGGAVDEAISSMCRGEGNMSKIILVAFEHNSSHEDLHSYAKSRDWEFADPYTLASMNEWRPGLAKYTHVTEWRDKTGCRFTMGFGVSPNNHRHYVCLNRSHPESRGYGHFWWFAFVPKKR